MNLQNLLKKASNLGSRLASRIFDSIFSTYTGQFITVTGIPSSGKSDWVDQMAIGYNLNMDGRQHLRL